MARTKSIRTESLLTAKVDKNGSFGYSHKQISK